MVVTAHAAISLDGRLSQAGVTTSLSTAEGRISAHSARAKADAVLVGSDTVRIDDPRLTVREADTIRESPMRVVLASRLRISPQARVFDKPGRVVVIGIDGDPAPLREVGAEVVLVAAAADGMVALTSAMAALRERGVERLLVEGGSRVLTSFFRAGLVDRLELELSTTILGAGTPLVGALGFAPRLTNVQAERLGSNMLVVGDVAK